MKPDRETMGLIGLVEEMKRRRIFVSLVMTRAETQVSWWDERSGQVRTGAPEYAQMHLNALNENDRQEVERVGQRMGGRTNVQGRRQFGRAACDHGSRPVWKIRPGRLGIWPV